MSAAQDVTQSLEQQAEEALRQARFKSECNRTTGEVFGVLRWWHSSVPGALSRIDGSSANVRALRLTEEEAWGLAQRLFSRDGATFHEVRAIERQCDLDRVLVLPVRVGKRTTAKGNGHKDDLSWALAQRARLIARSDLLDYIVRQTHREVHEALVGTGEGVGSPGCKWCKG